MISCRLFCIPAAGGGAGRSQKNTGWTISVFVAKWQNVKVLLADPAVFLTL